MGGINLNIDDTDQRYKQHTMYNYREKYKNIKSELAAAYVRDLISFQSDPLHQPTNSLNETLQELFRTFFPGKAFLGPKPTSDGRLSFSVELETGSTHDINDLSSGEKEILYGYLRLQNTSPRNSVVLLDEPELHLNPRLVKGLPRFYQKYLGEAKDNQIRLATHSDAFLRSVIGEPGFSVYHMRSPLEAAKSGAQIGRVSAHDEVEPALFDLVGDLAAYAPGGKLVVLEGGGDLDFDVRFVEDLFPELQRSANLISGENKARVRLLGNALEKAFAAKRLDIGVYTITDRDFDEEPELARVGRHLVWKVYHIENFLLSGSHIATVLTEAHRPKEPYTEDWVEEELRVAAASTIPNLVEHELRRLVNDAFIQSINLGFDPMREDKGAALYEAAVRSRARIEAVIADALSAERLMTREAALIAKFNDDLKAGNWKSNFRGREVLKAFASKHGGGISYSYFRNLIQARMKLAGHQPPLMKATIDEIMGRAVSDASLDAIVAATAPMS